MIEHNLMKKYSITFAIVFITLVSYSQNQYLDFKYGLKVSNLTSFEENTTVTISDPASGTSSQFVEKSLQIFHPTVAFLWKSKKNNFHEVELTSFSFRNQNDNTYQIIDSMAIIQTISGASISTVDISMRYEFILNFSKSKAKKLVPSVGFGVGPYFERYSSNPSTANFFPSTEIQTGIRTFITPRLTYFIGSKLFLDVNLPLCFTDLNVQTSERSDPTIPVEQRSISTFNFRMFPSQFSGRIGIGLKL